MRLAAEVFLTLLLCTWYLRPASAAHGGERALRVRQAEHGGTSDGPPQCTCDCCNVAKRRPEEVQLAALDVHVKCVASEEHGPEVCADQCTPPVRDENTEEEEQNLLPLDMLNFCFFECKPVDGVMSPLLAACVALEDDEARRVVDKNGNTVDPAIIYKRRDPAPSAMLLSKTRGGIRQVPPAPMPAASPAAAPGPGPAPAPGNPVVTAAINQAVKGITLAKDQEMAARLEADRLNRIEALKAAGAGSDPMAIIEDISEAAEGSRKAAERSADHARRAGEAMKAARANSWTTAVGAAGFSVQQFRAKAGNKALEEAATPIPWSELAAEASAQATRPYLRIVRQAQQMSEQWHMEAQDKADKARRFRNKAQGLEQDAAELEQEGDPYKATGKRTEAKLAWATADIIEPKARAAYGTAQEAASSANQWYKLAGEVARQSGANAKFDKYST